MAGKEGSTTEGGSLILVHCLMRHGHRTPDKITFFPTSPHKFNPFYPYGDGMLTNKGKAAAYATGKYLRERYSDFLDELYFPEIVEAWATEYERCRGTAGLVLAGLFPPKTDQKWSEELNWHPIKINYKSLDDDQLMGALVRNPHYIEMHAEQFKSGKGKALMERYADVIAYTAKHSGWSIPNTRRLYLVRDNLKSQGEFGLELPEWSKQVYPELLTEICLNEYEFETCTRALKRITCGLLLKKILTDSLEKIGEKSRMKLHLYAGHDVNVANVLTVLGAMYPHFPDYASMVALELHKIDDKYGFKLFYKRNVEEDFEPTNFGEAKPILWIEDYQKIVNDIWSDDDNGGDIKCQMK